MDWRQQCYELWGTNWKAQLSKMVQKNDRTVRKWNTDDIRIKPEVVFKIDATYRLWRD